ncbi:conserved hypothetical protein [Ricinus communis]|uniref:Uncharacterized protein n=1 Tax=Ricinus communis TaxID=3988 RepID=B9S9J0_RICCO|nr:conserved hypothetical protein [Ricinus communis]
MQYSSSKISRSSVAPSPEFLQQQKKEVGHVSLEAIHQAGAFRDIGQTICTLIQHVPNQHERENLEYLTMPRLAEFKEIVPGTITTAETAESQRSSLLEKSRELNANLVQIQKRLSSTEIKLSEISEEEGKLEMEIQELNARKEQLLARKKFVKYLYQSKLPFGKPKEMDLEEDYSGLTVAVRTKFGNILSLGFYDLLTELKELQRQLIQTS